MKTLKAIIFSVVLCAAQASAYPPIGICFTPFGPQFLTGDQTRNYALSNYNVCPDRVNNPEKPVTTNGCGGQSPWSRPPHKYAGLDFTGCCDNHDVCYSDCQADAKTGGQGKNTCDQGLSNCIVNKCNTLPSGWKVWDAIKSACYGAAEAYHQFVQYGGQLRIPMKSAPIPKQIGNPRSRSEATLGFCS
jgi:hypothetical protein